MMDWIDAKTTRLENGCWIWNGAFGGSGRYALVNYKGKLWRVTRLRFELIGAPLSPSEIACHKCDNPKCVNPEHIFIGSTSDNQRDCVSKNRKPLALGAENPCAKIDEAMVREILALLKVRAPQHAIAKRFGITQSNVSCIARGVS